MDIKQLKHFSALVEHGSYARASTAVCLSQPALSRSIQQLEKTLGAPLFERGRLGASLTVFGQAALVHIRAILAEQESLQQVLAGIHGLQKGELKIGTGPYPAFSLLDGLAGTFVERYPGIVLQLVNDQWGKLYRALLNHEIELFVSDVRQLQHDPALQITPLPSMSGVAVCRPEHPLCQLSSVYWRDLLGYPLALPSLPQDVESHLQAKSAADGGMQRRIQCDNVAMLLSVVSHSDAISLVPEPMFDRKALYGHLVKLPVQDIGELQTRFGIVQRAGRQLSPAAQAFFQLVIEQSL